MKRGQMTDTKLLQDFIEKIMPFSQIPPYVTKKAYCFMGYATGYL